jgi:hypothetical protein
VAALILVKIVMLTGAAFGTVEPEPRVLWSQTGSLIFSKQILRGIVLFFPAKVLGNRYP